MRRLALLLTLVAAHVLSGCTVTVPVVASGLARSAARRESAVSPATLHPGEPVRVLLRSAADVEGRWVGVDSTVVPHSYLLSVPNSERMAMPSDLVARLYRVPRPRSKVGPVLIGLLIDGAIGGVIYNALHSCPISCGPDYAP